MSRYLRILLGQSVAILVASTCVAAAKVDVPRFHVHEIDFFGPQLNPRQTPARDVELKVTFEHVPSRTTLTAFGFWDGDGKGGSDGNVFSVRFCPTEIGDWTISKVESNREEFQGQHVGDVVHCIASNHPGLWIADGKWYRRSDGSHPYIVGNTHYTFVSRQTKQGPARSNPAEDVRNELPYFNKIRFSLLPCRYPDPAVKPFFDDEGRPTDDGRYSFRPNPQWFHERVDPVVQAGFEVDVICDLILCGPDTAEARRALKRNPQIWVRYVASRYGAYPNVWYCLCNEWNIKKPNYAPEEIVAAGNALKAALLHNTTPISVHGNKGNWTEALNGHWEDHTIIQWKLKTIHAAADAAKTNIALGGGKPLVNDENAYEGEGDGFSEQDVIEGCLGTFLGGGYPTTGEKPANKEGQYFWGGFDPGQHKSADNLALLRTYLDGNVRFWELAAVPLKESPFSAAPENFRVLGCEREYVLGSNKQAAFELNLPPGRWQIVQLDLIAKESRTLADSASGVFELKTPNNRAVLTHLRTID